MVRAYCNMSLAMELYDGDHSFLGGEIESIGQAQAPLSRFLCIGQPQWHASLLLGHERGSDHITWADVGSLC